MSGHPSVMTIAAGLVALTVNVNADQSVPLGDRVPDTIIERHHYSMTARVRPLVVFWISRSGVGDAVVTRRSGPGQAGYSLLIGSDPERAPRRINRWGYIDEEVRGAETRLIGLMTELDEDTVEEAEASVGRQANGEHTFKIIQATIDHEEARSVVKSIRVPESYTFRDVGTLLALAQGGSSQERSRVVRLPVGTRPGFLSALADLIHAQVESVRTSHGVRPRAPVSFVYHGRIYELRGTRAQTLSTVTVGGKTYHHVVAADFEIKNTHNAEVTRFSMTVGAEGPLAEVPIGMLFQPRWWMQVELALDDGLAASTAVGGTHP